MAAPTYKKATARPRAPVPPHAGPLPPLPTPLPAPVQTAGPHGQGNGNERGSVKGLSFTPHPSHKTFTPSLTALHKKVDKYTTLELRPLGWLRKSAIRRAGHLVPQGHQHLTGNGIREGKEKERDDAGRERETGRECLFSERYGHARKEQQQPLENAKTMLQANAASSRVASHRTIA